MPFYVKMVSNYAFSMAISYVRDWDGNLPVFMGLSGAYCGKRVPSLTEGLDSPTLITISPRSDLTALLWQQTFPPVSVDLAPIPKRAPYQLPFTVTLTSISPPNVPSWQLRDDGCYMVLQERPCCVRKHPLCNNKGRLLKLYLNSFNPVLKGYMWNWAMDVDPCFIHLFLKAYIIW